MSKELGNQPQLVSLHQRLIRARMVRGLEGEPETAIDKLKRALWQVGKAEFFINEEQLGGLNQRVDEIRDWLITHGRDVSQDPFDRRGLQNREVEALNRGVIALYVYKDDAYDVEVDAKEPGTNFFDAHRLVFTRQYQEADVRFLLDFQDQYSLMIEFHDLERPGKYEVAYNSFSSPLSLMTTEEYDIIMTSFKQFASDVMQEPHK